MRRACQACYSLHKRLIIGQFRIIMINNASSIALEQRFTCPDGFEWRSFERDSSHGVRKIRVGLCRAENAVVSVVVLPGLSEFGEKYFELCRDLNAQQMNVFIIDWFGQGKSGRYFKDTNKRHSHGFDEDLHDLDMAMSTIITPNNNAPLVMIGHSMGGNIGLRYLCEHPDMFKAAAFSAPFLGLKEVAIVPRPITRALLATMNKLMPTAYGPGQKDWSADLRESDERSKFSGDPVRDRIHNYWCETDPTLQQGGVTWGWICAAFRSCFTLKGALKSKSIKTPLLIAKAGQDEIVDNNAIDDAAETLDAKLMTFDTAQHEIFMETDDIRRVFLDAILKHIQAYIS